MMRINYGECYKVTIEFNKEVLTVEEVAEMIDHNFSEEDILSYGDYQVSVIWDIPTDEGVHEIENALFYMLKNGEYGMFSYEDFTEYEESTYTYDLPEAITIKTEMENGERIGYYRVNHLVGPPKSEEYKDQVVEIRVTGHMRIYDSDTKEFVTSFMAHRDRLEVVMLRAGEIPSEELLRHMERNRNKVKSLVW